MIPWHPLKAPEAIRSNIGLLFLSCPWTNKFCFGRGGIDYAIMPVKDFVFIISIWAHPKSSMSLIIYRNWRIQETPIRYRELACIQLPFVVYYEHQLRLYLWSRYCRILHIATDALFVSTSTRETLLIFQSHFGALSARGSRMNLQVS